MSLISKGDIRYEGILSHIDMDKSEICLQQGVPCRTWIRGQPVTTLHPGVQPPHDAPQQSMETP